MRVNTSISIPEDKLRALDELIGPSGNRSRAVELAVDELLVRLRRARDRADLEIYAAFEDELTAEVTAALACQAKEPEA
jgi:metal-responsive CopG/Arc/MetJ family transcriptional regulator